MSHPPEINPFEDLHVKEPHRSAATVPGLNETPLRGVVERFERLAAGPPPRADRHASHAAFITSAEPGFGKSHLIARLFQELRGRATLVYVLPFHHSATAFHSIMLAVAHELDAPDRGGADEAGIDPVTQLDWFAHHVLAHAVADLIEHGPALRIEFTAPPGAADLLREAPLAAWNRGTVGDPWADLLRAEFPRLLDYLVAALERRGIRLTQPRAWLRVLFAYAFSPLDVPLRRACLDWITAQPSGGEDGIDGTGVKLHGLERVDPESSSSQINQLCRTRLTELCQLAAFHRPLVFCLDQTEVYGHDADLAHSLGMVIATLVNEGKNQLTVVTSNFGAWEHAIRPHMELADLDRLMRPPLQLEGVDRGCGEALARLRLERWEKTSAQVEQFFAGGWLEKLYQNRTQYAAREFLRRCQERWDLVDAPPGTPPPVPGPPKALGQHYLELVAHMLADPRRHGFEPGTLAWVVEQVARGVPGLKVARVPEARGRTTYFPVEWETADRLCLFAFEAGGSAVRWKNLAASGADTAGERGRPVKVICLRTQEQPPIPGPRWTRIGPIILEARRTHLQILVLTREEAAAWSAAKALYAAAAAGDAQPHSVEDVLAFLRVQFAPWWERLQAPLVPPTPEELATIGPSPAGLVMQVRKIVQRERFLSAQDVAAQVPGGSTVEAVLAACAALPEIRIHTSHAGTVLQWG